MSRYKGRASRKNIERDLPHVVEIVVPPGGLGKCLDAMHTFHAVSMPCAAFTLASDAVGQGVASLASRHENGKV